MGMICHGYNYPYFLAVERLLKENGIPVLVQEVPTGYGLGWAGRALTVRDVQHERAMRILREAGLDPAYSNLSTTE